MTTPTPNGPATDSAGFADYACRRATTAEAAVATAREVLATDPSPAHTAQWRIAAAVRAEVAVAVWQTAARHGAEAGLDIALTYATDGTHHTDPFSRATAEVQRDAAQPWVRELAAAVDPVRVVALLAR